MVNVTPELTVTLPTTIYGEPASVQVVGVEIVPLTFVAACAGKENPKNKRIKNNKKEWESFLILSLLTIKLMDINNGFLIMLC